MRETPSQLIAVQDARLRPDSDGRLRLIALPHLGLEHGRIDCYVPEGETVAGHLRSIGWQPDGLSARVFIDGQYIEQARWEQAIPAAGQALTVRVIPMGGGGQGGKDALRIVAMLGVIVLSIFAPYAAPVGWGLVGSWSGAALTAVVSIAGSLAVNALIPPPRPRLTELSGQGNTSQNLSLTGTANAFAPYGVIPRIYGRYRVYPPLAARPFTEIVGNDQYLRLLFCFGYGPLALEDFKIGETPISQFEDVEMEIRYGYAEDPDFTLFPNDVYEDSLSIALTQANDWQQRTSQANARELSWDITFPSGLVQMVNGVPDFWAVQIEVEARRVGDVTWTPVNDTPAIAASRQILSGLNNCLLFTLVTSGSYGNGVTIQYVAPEGTPGAEQISVLTESPTSLVPVPGDAYAFNLTVTLRFDGVNYSTAAQVKAAVEAALPGIFTITYPTGSGTDYVTPTEVLYLDGGRSRLPSFEIRDAQQTQVRASLRWIVPTVGQYETRVRRISGDTSSLTIADQSFWTMLRTIQAGPPVLKHNLAGVAMRIKATGQLNGTVDQFNAITTSILPDWTGTSWVTRPTQNPASIYRDVLQGAANKRPKADGRLDLITIQDFHERCTAQGFTFNAAIDFRTTVKQLRQDVLAAGRGTFGLRDMKYSVVQDLLQSTPVDVITPRTSYGFTWAKRFLDMPHGFRVRFVDEANSWKQGERFVYADGYTEETATILEDVDAGLGVTNGDQVWKLKRRELADALLRADDYTVQMDFAHLTFTRGDRLQLQHDVILAGLVTARVKTVTVNGGGDALSITMDDVVTMAAGTSYAVRIKSATGAQVVQAIVTVPGETSSLTFTVPIPVATVPVVGDVLIVGVLGSESLDVIVKAIEMGTDYAATVRLLDYAPAIQTADSGPIPTYTSHLTMPSEDRFLIPNPIIDQVQSDETALLRDLDGSFQSRILITLHFTSGFGSPVSKLEAHYRRSGVASEWTELFAPISGTGSQISVMPVQQGLSYDVRIRTVNEDSGATSPWISVLNHTVIGQSSLPPDVMNLNVSGGQLIWAYPSAPQDFAGFRVRVQVGSRRTWDDAIPLHDGLVSLTSYVLALDTGIRTYLVKGVDTAGNESAEAATLTIDYGSLPTQNVAETIDLKALGFPGTIVNGTVAGGNLQADTDTVAWTGDDLPAWTSDADAYWVGAYKAMQYTATIVPPSDWLAGRILLDLTVSGNGYQVEYRRTNSAEAWTNDADPAWTNNADPYWDTTDEDYFPWPGSLENYARQPYDFRLTALAGSAQGLVATYGIVFDMDDVTELVQNVALDAGGTRLPLTKTYHVIKSVFPTLVPDGGSAIAVRVVDKDRSGPLLQGIDVSLVGVSAHTDALVQGY